MSIFIDINGKIRYKGFSVLTFDLVDRITSIRKHFGSSKSVRIRCQKVALTFFSFLIAAGICQIDFKYSAFLRLFNDPGIGVVAVFGIVHIRILFIRMLHDLDISVDHFFRNIIFCRIQFHFVERRRSAYFMDRFI